MYVVLYISGKVNLEWNINKIVIMREEEEDEKKAKKKEAEEEEEEEKRTRRRRRRRRKRRRIEKRGTVFCILEIFTRIETKRGIPKIPQNALDPDF